MMNNIRKFILSATIFLAIFFASTILACEPCKQEINLSETINASDLIIVGQQSVGGADQVKQGIANVEVLNILKGEEKNKIIGVRDASTACNYGIDISSNKPNVIFLQKEDDIYTSVNLGCAWKNILIEDGNVDIAGEKVSLKKFINDFGLKASGSGNFWNIAYGVLTVILVLFLVWGMKSKTKKAKNTSKNNDSFKKQN